MDRDVIIRRARMDLGLAEVPGKGSNARIRSAIKAAASWLDGDDSKTAWCGCIRGLWGMETGTGVPPEHYRAASWLKWGEPVELRNAEQGDTVVLKRVGGFHVALFDGWDGAWAVRLLGGNQSDCVCYRRYAVPEVLGVRKISAVKSRTGGPGK